MKKIYLAVFVTFVVSTLLFISSLFYLDKEKHKTYHFAVMVDGKDAGSVKIDKFVTDDNLFYKSQSYMPFMPLITDSKSRLTLDKRYGLISYSRDESGSGAQNAIHIERIKDTVSFVGTGMSEFACLTGLPIKNNTFIFEEYSPSTYIPILENYDFSMGRAQAFNVITCYSPLLPPMKRLLTLTSIRNEYMKIGSRKIKVECLLIRMKDMPQGMLFVTMTGRSLVCIEFPDKKLRFMRTFVPKNLKSKPLILKSDAYSEEEIKFSNKKTTLSGTITVPKKDDKCAAVLLLGGFEESDREEQGLFTHVADMLGKNGYLALRFDRRGIGSSQGSSGSSTYSEGLDDAKSALDYLLARKEADPQRVFIIAHGSGALYAAKIASDMKNLKGLVLMSPVATLAGQTSLNFDNLNEMAAKRKWDDLYLKLAIKSRMETIDRVKNSKNNWTYILGTRCFLKKIKEAFEENPTDIIRKVECPVLILHGKEDDLIPSKDVAGLDKALEESQNKDHKLIYYGYLGHFFGKQINDGEHKLYYNTDPAVLETIIKWLDAITKIDLT